MPAHHLERWLTCVVFACTCLVALYLFWTVLCSPASCLPASSWLPPLPLLLLLQISYKGATLHHYISKSLADFEVKAARRGGAGSVRTMAHFRKWARQSTDTCTRAVPLGQALAVRYDLQHNVPQWCLRPVSRSDPDLADERR